MPAWMHARAEHILAKNPSMPKGEAFAIATQQSHALGKTPKSYGTPTGKHMAKEKYDTPGDDKKTAAWEDKLPGGLSDKKTPTDFDSSSLREGRKVEKEHTKDKHLQTEISMDHLTEDPAYYKKLEKMEKDAVHPALVAGGAGALAAAGAAGGVYLGVGEKGRKRINSEIRDPRLYSNLRGMGTLESAKDRVAAHKHLKRGKHTVMSAMHEGFTRGSGTEKKAEYAMMASAFLDELEKIATDRGR